MFILTVLGALTAAYFLVRFLLFVKLYFLTSVDLKAKYGKVGSWAVVTGASEGIGHAIAVELSQRGFNVCVIARTKSKLDEAVAEIESNRVKGLAIPFDFSAATNDQYKALFAQLDTLDIGILVNNVGINYDYANYFDAVGNEVDDRLIKVNCEPMIRLSKYIIPRFKTKKGGAIVNLASFTATTPSPMLSTYAGTKSFARSFSDGMAYELAEFGIDVLTVKPGLVVSKMTQGTGSRPPKPSFTMVAAKPMARQTLNKLGSTVETSGHVNHAIIESIWSWLPEGTSSKIILGINKTTKSKAERKLSK